MQLSHYFNPAVRRKTNLSLNELNIAWIKPSNLDSAYLEFICEFFEMMRDDGLLLYAAEDLFERNSSYELSRYACNCLLIGDDSGGIGFLIDTSSGEVYSSGLGDLSPLYFKLISKSFKEWALSGFVMME